MTFNEGLVVLIGTDEIMASHPEAELVVTRPISKAWLQRQMEAYEEEVERVRDRAVSALWRLYDFKYRKV